MIKIAYKNRFVRRFNSLPESLQIEAFEKIDLFRNSKNHRQLKVHKLHGYFSGCFSFSVNYKIRVVFEYISKNEVAFLTIGDHDLYK